jgi:plasmid replication initiation protein
MKDLEVNSKELKSDALVQQGNKITNGRWRMNINQSRIFLAGVSMIHPNDTCESYKIGAKQLAEMLGLSGGSIYDRLSKDIPKLMQQYIIIDRDNDKKEWISIMSSARYDDGNLYLKFSDEIKPFLLGLKDNFTQFRLIDAMKLQSMYALRFYMLFKQYDSTGWRYITVEEIRQVLDLDQTKENDLKKDLYTTIGNLKSRVINPSIKELNEKGFPVTVQEYKEGRKIIAFKFKWKIGTELVGHQEIVKASTDQGKRLIERLEKYKLNARQINHIAKLVKAGHITFKEMANCLFGLDSRIRTKIAQGGMTNENIPGYVYVTLKKTFNLSNF